MNTDYCEFISSFVVNPQPFAKAGPESREKMLEHISLCSKCSSTLDELSDESAALFFEMLAKDEQSSHEDGELESRLEEIVRADKSREQDIRKAVQNSLMPGFMSAAGRMAKSFDPIVLYSATEAVSMLIRSYLRFKKALRVPFVELKADGSVFINESEAISASTMAGEIARTANLWELAKVRQEDTTIWPLDQGRQLAEWTFLATHERPNLLRDFRAAAVPSTGGFLGSSIVRFLYGAAKPTAPLLLMPLKPSDRIDDLNERWKPLMPDPMFIYAVPSQKSGQVPILEFTTEEFSSACTAYRTQQTWMPSASHQMAFFVVDKKLSTSVRAKRRENVLVDSKLGVRCTIIEDFKEFHFGEGKLRLVKEVGSSATIGVQRLDIPISLSLDQ
jgi:hypothetical protein